MKWIRPFNERVHDYDLEGALHDCGVDWNRNNNKYEIGDIVYIFECEPENRIKYKCVVTDDYKMTASFNDEAYGGVNKGYRYANPAIETQLVYEFKRPVTLEELLEHGMREGRKTVMKETGLRPEIFRFLDECEKKDREGTRIDEVEVFSVLSGEEREAVIKVRVNQGRFREGLLKKYNHCCLCAVSSPALLSASHIKPWAESEPGEKTDINNGLLLCPNHDRLFDKGFITFENDGSIIISEELSENDRMFMNVSGSMTMEMNGRMASFMEYHREHVFRG